MKQIIYMCLTLGKIQDNVSKYFCRLILRWYFSK